MSKHSAMFEYLRASPVFPDIACQFGTSEDGAVIFNTLEGENIISEDILGNKTKNYDFAIITFRPFNGDAGSSQNLEVLEAVQKLVEWIDTQETLKNYPDFGNNCNVEKIENLQNIPGVAGYDENAGLAKYMFQARVTYIEQGE